MHIVLLILKILGILLLVILGLLLLILLTVLFVPVRYRIQGLWKDEKWAGVQVTWLLSLVSFQGGYNMKKGLTGSFRVLWFKFWKMGEEETEETEEGSVEETPSEGKWTEERRTQESLVGEKKENKEVKKREQERTEAEPEVQEKGELVQAMEVKKVRLEESEKKTHSDPGTGGQIKRPDKAEIKKNDEEKPHEPKPYIPLSERIKAIWTRAKTFFQKLKFSFLYFCDKLKDIKAFVQEKKEWLENEENQESFRLLFKQFKKLFAHVWPCKGKGTVTFGLEDPCYTGQILAGASLLYPFFYKRLSLQPVFDEKCLEAELDYRGRVRVSYLLWLFWGIFHHKHTWKMIRGFLDRDNSSDE